MTLLFWTSLLALAVAWFAAVGSRSLRRFSRGKLEELGRQEQTAPLYSQIVQRRDRAALGAESLQVLAAAIAVGAGILWFGQIDGLGTQPAWLGLLAAGAGIVLLWLVLVWIPAAMARLWADPYVLSTWSFWNMVAFVLSPSIAAAQGIARLLQFISGRQPAQATEESLEEEILSIVNEGRREGLLEQDAREMIEGVIELGDVDVAQIMTPRTDVVSMHVELSWDEGVQFVAQSGHSRIPVYKKSPDNVVGILHTKDLLAELAKPGRRNRPAWPELLRKPFFVPETKRVDALLQEFQRSRNHIAVVLDEFGGVSGIVTLEDALEEIVGEIADEHDEALIDGIKTLGEHSSEALASVRIHELNERLGLALPEDENFDTIGGFVFHELGRIPNVGEELVWQDVRIKVLEATRRRINRVAIQVLEKPQPAV